MDKQRVFNALAGEEPSVLLDLLKHAYNVMKIDQRRDVFGTYVRSLPPEPIDGEDLLIEIEVFRDDSLAGYYYEPFEIRSYNYRHIPEETEAWFEKMGDYLKASRQLTEQGDHTDAVACFRILYALIDRMEDGQEIVFADEYGSWMIPGDEKTYIAAHMTSLAATTTPNAFTEAAIPLIRRDSYQSLATQAYASAIRAADEEQQAHLEAEVKRQEIRTEPRR